MAATVLLRHDTPDGESHYDWMIERGESLMTFRVTDRIDRGCPQFDAVPLPDHRAEYLYYQGPISGGRGTVTRLATGTVEVLPAGPGCLLLRGSLGDASGTFGGRSGPRATWHFTFVPAGKT